MIKKTIDSLRNHPVSITQWMVGFVGILLVRLIFESLSSPSLSGLLPSDPFTLIHYGLFFLATVLGLMVIVGSFTQDFIGPAKLILFGLPIIWIAPILDILLSGGEGFRMAYIFDTHLLLVKDFFTFFGPHPEYGATFGIRIEVALVMASIGYYIWLVRKKISLAVLGAIASYALVFILFVIPGIFYTLSLPNSASSPVLMQEYLQNSIQNSNIFHNTLREGAQSVTPSRFFEHTFNKLMSQVLFLISVIFMWMWMRKAYPDKLKVVLQNARVERILFYLTLLLLGMMYAVLSGYSIINTWIDVISVLCLAISWSGLWLYAVQVNDIADVEVDKISNPERPLVVGGVGENDMSQVGFIFLTIGLLGAWVVGFYPFFMSLVFTASYYIYSATPLRLKRVPLLSSFLISIACLVTVLCGFYFVSGDKRLDAFPMLLIGGILVMFTLATNVRDVKDIEGDRAQNINTLPVLFGENGKRVVGALFALSFLLFPFFISFYLLYVLAIPAAIIGYKLVNRVPYKEKYIFTLYFVFFILAIALVGGLFWLLNDARLPA